MEKFSLDNKPDDLKHMIKRSGVSAKLMTEPFQIETQEGLFTISPETVDDWGEGYYVVYPDDGSKPYGFSKTFADSNYIFG